MSDAGVCFCHLPRNMKSPNNSVTCRASHALSKLLLGAVAQNLVLRDEKEDEDNMYTALVSKAAPGREDARHPKCGPSSGNSTQSVRRHAEIHAGGSRLAYRPSEMRVDLRTVRQKLYIGQLMRRRGGPPWGSSETLVLLKLTNYCLMFTTRWWGLQAERGRGEVNLSRG